MRCYIIIYTSYNYTLMLHIRSKIRYIHEKLHEVVNVFCIFATLATVDLVLHNACSSSPHSHVHVVNDLA